MVIDASFGHEALRAIGQAFDAASAEIAGNFGSDPQDIECLRLRLAKAMLSIANEDSRDVDVLKQTTLEQMALDYRKSGGAHKEKGASRGNGVARCTWRHLNGDRWLLLVAAEREIRLATKLTPATGGGFAVAMNSLPLNRTRASEHTRFLNEHS